MSLHNIASECVCYVHCNFCNTNLVVNVPGNITVNVVTVKCGHCSNLLSLNTEALPQNTHNLQNVLKQNIFYQDLSEESGSSKSTEVSASDSSSENEHPRTLSVHGTMGKRQRAPSAYNKFIKEEIRRLKINNPKITHKEAFSTAAKNWAHLPHTDFGLTLNGNIKEIEGQGA
ncbi:protein YABBY 2 isoform X2 [Manihot esculenta]|uniref:Uncharacterized protein n=1 Tax=Manihot esculenta TaxID=3983 RepID=A0A2C9VFE1_MANES|nr:protein YABBY 2 isoform X2 [Manihot esculenta]OAY43020.1 hypothetical protein MANES_08G035700v8 [Manihot esculenta]